MGIKEVHENFNRTGVRGHIPRLMSEGDQGFGRELPGGCNGEIVSERLALCSGPYLHYRRREPVLRHSNQSLEDGSFEAYRDEV